MIDQSTIDLLALVGEDTQLKKTGNMNNGAWSGPCPFCGGRDRFNVWPHHPKGNGQWWCRGCEKRGTL
ncbi:MAG: hypothetical protein GY832_32125 [Chloroflexi bacterium]|nr:hypothetical protein [Chloroflexota bacterium]